MTTAASPPLVRHNVRVPFALGERVRDASFWSGDPASAICRAGLESQLKVSEFKHGGRFGRRLRELQGGRRYGPTVGGDVTTFTVLLPADVSERLLNAIAGTPGATLISFGQEALEREIGRMEKGRGEKFKPRTKRELRRGRRAGR